MNWELFYQQRYMYKSLTWKTDFNVESKSYDSGLSDLDQILDLYLYTLYTNHVRITINLGFFHSNTVMCSIN